MLIYSQSSAGFTEFVAKLTNGSNDLLATCQLSLGAGGARTVPSQCGEGPEHGILQRRQINPDLKGRTTVDFVRLVVNKVEVGLHSEFAGWTFARYDVVWQFWSGMPRFEGRGERPPIDRLLTFAKSPGRHDATCARLYAIRHYCYLWPLYKSRIL